ncbi:hypothetical protein C3Y94_033595 (plasmid) [Rhizobium ruizarguesonis]|uniref:hypothetical protein n=1 Tax=Rhizobium ruizarguesonis TaxID=2081791 RepID=UPI001639F72B|nr:hypothetical protein [Rhizobium ruizarguesonis]MBC2808059.1 hypothetical protein [Rhizobium ruizarguesonis]
MGRALIFIGRILVFTVLTIFKALVFANKAFSATMRKSEKKHRQFEANAARQEVPNCVASSLMRLVELDRVAGQDNKAV